MPFGYCVVLWVILAVSYALTVGQCCNVAPSWTDLADFRLSANGLAPNRFPIRLIYVVEQTLEEIYGIRGDSPGAISVNESLYSGRGIVYLTQEC
jgi:hypothetical protein